ncbi:MAG: exosortase/archaeosortase family protein, partial [Verrucomicrobia bacterium]|nr:exosortase/archaeosortase family protein [Verrucomicrobiota bacterium]
MNTGAPPVLANDARPASDPLFSAAAVLDWKRWAYWLPSLWLWITLFVELAPEWSTNAQYSHGWLVPALGAALLRQRWRSRPPPAPEAQWRPAWNALMILGILAYLPLRWLEQGNPEWRLLLWVHAGVAALVTGAQLAILGGRRWVSFFAFTILWPWIAVPWPTGLENAVVQQLTRAAASLTTELANLTGIPAFQQGNVIEIRTGVVGIEEACSGIRSLQAALLGSLFLGALFSLSTPRRWALLSLSVALAFAANVARTYTLVFVAHQHGLKEAERVHDGAALVAMGAGLGGLFLAAKWLERSPRLPAVAPAPDSDRRVPGALFSPALVLWPAAWMILATVAVEGWYRSAERSLLAHARFWV